MAVELPQDIEMLLKVRRKNLVSVQVQVGGRREGRAGAVCMFEVAVVAGFVSRRYRSSSQIAKQNRVVVTKVLIA